MWLSWWTLRRFFWGYKRLQLCLFAINSCGFWCTAANSSRRSGQHQVEKWYSCYIKVVQDKCPYQLQGTLYLVPITKELGMEFSSVDYKEGFKYHMLWVILDTTLTLEKTTRIPIHSSLAYGSDFQHIHTAHYYGSSSSAALMW